MLITFLLIMHGIFAVLLIGAVSHQALGVFWPRRRQHRYPGTIVVEVLDAIPPGLDEKTFFEKLQNDIESATARLIEEARAKGKGFPVG